MQKPPIGKYIQIGQICLAGAVGAMMVSSGMTTPGVAAVGATGLVFLQSMSRRSRAMSYTKKLTLALVEHKKGWSEEKIRHAAEFFHNLVHSMLKKDNIAIVSQNVTIMARFLEGVSQSSSANEPSSTFADFLKLFNVEIDPKTAQYFELQKPQSIPKPSVGPSTSDSLGM